MNWLGIIIQQYVKQSDTVLDIGCGIMQATTDILGTKGNEGNLICREIIGLDAYPKYLEQIKNRYPTIVGTTDQTNLFLDQSYDVVICLDVLEHLHSKAEADKLLDEMKRIARKYVVAYTPSAFHTNEEHAHESWGLGENELQEHHILMTIEDFARHGYQAKSVPPENNLLAIHKTQ